MKKLLFFVTSCLSVQMLFSFPVLKTKTDSVAVDSTKKLKELFVTSNRINPLLYNSSKTISIKEIQIINQGQDIPTLLETTPSAVSTSDAGNGIGYSALRIRGTDQTRINVTINGIPYNDAEAQSVYFVDIPDIISSAQDVQIQRGLVSSTAGTGAFGGSISIRTTGVDSAFFSLKNSIGSFNSTRNSVAFSTGKRNGWIADVRGSKISSDGYIDRASSKLWSSYFSLGKFGKNYAARIIYFNGFEKTYQAWNGVYEDDLAKNRTVNYAGTDWGSKAGEPYNNEIDNYKQHHVQAHFSTLFKEKIKTNLSLHYTKGKGYYEEYKVDKAWSNYGIASTNSSDLIRQRWLNNDYYGAIFSVQAPHKNIDYLWNIAVHDYVGKHYGDIIQTFSDTPLVLPHRYYNNTGNKMDISSFLKATYSKNKFTAYIDAQIRMVKYTANGTENDLNSIGISAQYLFFNPKAGMAYRWNKKQHTSFTAAIGNREPDRTDFTDALYGGVPTSERLLDIELGHTFTTKKGIFSATLYGMNYWNQLINSGKINDVGSSVRINVPNSYRVGLELDGKYVASTFFTIEGNLTISRNKIKSFNELIYTYDENYVRIDELTENKTHRNTDISFSPNMIGFLKLSSSPIKNLTVAVQLKHVGKQYLDNTQNEARKLAAYTLPNAQCSYTISLPRKASLNLSLLLNNLTNTLYQSNGYTYNSGRIKTGTDVAPDMYYNYCFPQAGFNFMFGTELRF